MKRRSFLGRLAAVACAPFARLFVTPLPPDCQGRRAEPFAKGGVVRGGPGYFGAHDHPESVLPLRRRDVHMLGPEHAFVSRPCAYRPRECVEFDEPNFAGFPAGRESAADGLPRRRSAHSDYRAPDQDTREAPSAAREAYRRHLSATIHPDFAPDRHALAESINRGGVTGLHTDVDDLSDYAEQGVRG